MRTFKGEFIVESSPEAIQHVRETLRSLIGISLQHPEWTRWGQPGAEQAMQLHRSEVAPRLIAFVTADAQSAAAPNALYWLIKLREQKVLEVLTSMLQSHSEDICKNARYALSLADIYNRGLEPKPFNHLTDLQFLQQDPLLLHALSNHTRETKSIVSFDPFELAIRLEVPDVDGLVREEIDRWVRERSITWASRQFCCLTHFSNRFPDEYGSKLAQLFESGCGESIVTDSLEHLGKPIVPWHGVLRETTRRLAQATIRFLLQLNSDRTGGHLTNLHSGRLRQCLQTMVESGLRRPLIRLINHLSGQTAAVVIFRVLSLADPPHFYDRFFAAINALVDPRPLLWSLANVSDDPLPPCLAFRVRQKLKAFQLTDSDCKAFARLTNTCPEIVCREFNVETRLTVTESMELASPILGFDEQELLKLSQVSGFAEEKLRKAADEWKGHRGELSTWGGAAYNVLKRAGFIAYFDKKFYGDQADRMVDLCVATEGVVHADALYIVKKPVNASRADEDEDLDDTPERLLTLVSEGVMYQCPIRGDRDDRIRMVWFMNRILIEKQSHLRCFAFEFDEGFFVICTTKDVAQRLAAAYSFRPHLHYQEEIDSPEWPR